MKYQVGDLTAIKETDPEFDTLDQAYAHALQLCEDSDENMVGVWTGQDDGSELIAIAYQGDWFTK